MHFLGFRIYVLFVEAGVSRLAWPERGSGSETRGEIASLAPTRGAPQPPSGQSVCALGVERSLVIPLPYTPHINLSRGKHQSFLLHIELVLLNKGFCVRENSTDVETCIMCHLKLNSKSS